MWIIYALSASIFWGMTYVLNEEIYKKISFTTSLAVASFVIFIIMTIVSYLNNTLKTDLVSIVSSKKTFFFVLAGILALLIAEVFIGLSITHKSAVLAGLVEISYPIFIALFSYLLFKNQISVPTIVGAVFIFGGIFITYYFNK
jgi:uncharacterized membrane protein